MKKALSTGLLLIIAAAALPARADEGMWTFDQFPNAALKSRYGVSLDPAWLDRVRLATVRMEGGCTGSFVSKSGLVLTNHHCARDCLQRISTPARDTMAEGFMARTPAEEERCPADQVSVLTRIEDVTAKVTDSVGAAIGPESNEKRKAVLTRLEQACEEAWRRKRDPHACEAVTLYGGGRYALYHYKRYEDLRLVLAPENDIAFFGGDVDNFEFPRWNLDFTLMRVYENGKPAATPDFLRWRRSGAAAGEPVFVAGHPGSTERLKTVSELRFDRNLLLNHWLLRSAELRGRLLQYQSEGPEPARIAQKTLFGVENVIKVRRNQMDVLLDEGFLAGKQKDEDELRSATAADAALKGYAGAWADVDRALATYQPFFDRHVFVDLGAAMQGDLATWARLLVRVGLEREKPNEERQRDFTEAALPLLKAQLLAPAPVYPDLETLRLTYSLEKMVEFLGIDDPAVRLALGRDSPRTLATRLVRETKLGDPAFRQQLWDGGRAAVEKSGDPLIALALRLQPEADRVRKRYEDEVEATLLASEEKIARARFAVRGTSVYPDATFTLRLTYGTVRGWREGDRDVAPFTTLEGLYSRATGQPPFRLPARWAKAQDKVNLDTRFNFVSDVDIVGGNSGSPVLDAQGRLVGLIFDGNRHSIGGSYWFDPALNRAVAVHPAALVLALSEVYGASRIVDELAIE
jgi:hypothetical protein